MNMKWYKIVDESVRDTIKRTGSDIFTEMALPLKTFRARVDNLRFQLIQNWCLLKYCQLYDSTNENFAHWGVEFKSSTDNLRDFEIKGGIDKKKTLVKMFIEDYDYNEARKILVIIRDKFDKEKITDATKRKAVAEAFSSSIQGLIDFLCDTSISNASYMNTTFNVEIDESNQ